MKFNVVRIGNRDFADLGDLNACLFNLSMTKNKLDRSTLATVISANNYITSRFAEKQPQERTLYEVSVVDGRFYKEIKRVLKENKKSLKKSDEELITLDTETYLTEQGFTETQINQVKKLLEEQNQTLQKLFLEAVSKVKINVTPPLAPASGTTKKKTSS